MKWQRERSGIRRGQYVVCGVAPAIRGNENKSSVGRETLVDNLGGRQRAPDEVRGSVYSVHLRGK